MKNYEIIEGNFISFDKTELFYRTWKPKNSNEGDIPGRVLILLHRGHEHSGRLQDLVEGIASDDMWCFAYDGRGHGKNPGPRGYAPDFGFMIKDLNSFVQFLIEKHNIKMENITIVANSVGAVITSTWVHDYAPKIRAMILAAPAFYIKLYVPFALFFLRILNAFKHPAFISSYVKSKFLTHDPAEQKKYDSDPLITPQIAVNILLGLYDHANRTVIDAAAIHVPTLILSAGSDWVVGVKQQKQFFDQLSSTTKEFVEYPTFYHGVLYEKEKNLPFQKSREFIERVYSQELFSYNLINADQQGYTKQEYENLLRKSLPLWKAFYYAFTRLMMATFGRLSQGIRIGLNHGFDSGLSLDYVYENNPRGITGIGRFIDRCYLDAVGWKGIRARKINLQKNIEETINRLLKEHRPVRVMDIAAGPGRYLLEVAQKYNRDDVKFLIRDYDPRNIEKSRLLARELNCKNVEFIQGDAFDPKSFDANNFAPNVIVISGLYELFDDNKMVANSIMGATSVLQKPGYVIYTGQPWHPQLELIAHTLPNRDGNRWVMRRRTQAELDQLFYGSGLVKQDMSIDEWGIFTVSRAQNQQ
ncbi:MAG: hypothetical protein A2504_12475 [Bdellovibrionales bacterium RIFOXYD12_FULL_39_22]|nr:MAG: hypothetical protein A2385_00185 [Bdellovibrionales bacterium RIFOXYB1_FULL_39_21]OFZ44074.1 MAG: hypothetical protein A2485_03850 [Bdellovibrionales bacterium RIFOXYC12_FULL_39_17]OFZ48524.1 MAG: hypothetical protein A2404_07220 [Bdellovibrionales bacterium RIFOXYC1_FULL_39_130]OFZ76712.1 MAG: hypothetical protein A2560_11595 [Bdellovibrionales bacterium RIFOXYD1_FULL_39_84]OFZ94990.1 MAG: hypothetical protein A2504_12475 [Bdellovibrionales bacterium RIFOXYD12_FULL_39_22]HLE11201.1 bi